MLRSTLLTITILLGATSLAFASEYPIDGIPDLIPAAQAAKLKAAGVATTQTLLEKGATVKTRKALAKATQLDEKMLRDFVDAADVMRVKGIGPKMVRLLRHVKVRTLATLKKQKGAKLAAAIEKAKPELAADLKEKLPDKVTLDDWIGQAKTLKALVK